MLIGKLPEKEGKLRHFYFGKVLKTHQEDSSVPQFNEMETFTRSFDRAALPPSQMQQCLFKMSKSSTLMRFGNSHNHFFSQHEQ